MKRALLLIFAFALSACPEGTGPGVDDFEDHTVASIDTEADWFARAQDGGSTHAAKFAITDILGEQPQIRHYDSTFYALHDEWYWFRLMNGARVPGDVVTEPFSPEAPFESIEAITTFARELDDAGEDLPVGLRFVRERLYSPRFYELALQSPRRFGVGTVIYAPERSFEDENGVQTRPETWAFELEYSDRPSHDEIVIFFEQLLSSLPPSIASELRWLVRSPAQETLAQLMEERGLSFADRIMRYSELAIPGETEVYSEGLIAGRLKIIRSGEGGLDETSDDDVLILGEVPDFLPPARALLTSVPQTPLAHVNILARNRGIPNAYLGGAIDDPNLDQLARVRAPVIVLAEDGELVVEPISEAEFAQFRALSRPSELVVPAADIANAPYALDLASVDDDDLDDLRPIIGGKSAGFVALFAGEVTMPDAPLAITARAYAEHIEEIRTLLALALVEQEMSSDKTSTLVLEGPEVFLERFPNDAALIDTVENAGGPLAELLARGGVRPFVENKPIAPQTRDILRATLAAHFSHYDVRQGLRFRSSASVEDIEGFNGAGLYTSNTGFLDPAAAGENPERTIERALKRTWGSYWGTEAFNERELANVVHLSGNMAVLVHARFDDDKERSNAVFTYTIFPDGAREMEVNVQVGALSVTNPPPGVNALPEVSVVAQLPGGLPEVERLASSTETNDEVLRDQELFEVFEQAGRVTARWLARENTGLLTAQRRSTLTLDFELREMDLFWPLLENGNTFPRRHVIKQARSLEPGLRQLPSDLLAQPVPRDVLARAAKVTQRDCLSDAFTMAVVEVNTDPLKLPDLGHTRAPFTGFMTFDLSRPLFDLDEGARFTVVHTAFASQQHPGMDDGGPWNIAIDVDDDRPEASTRFSTFAMSTDGSWTMSRGDEVESGTWTGCQVDVRFSSPTDFLRSLLRPAD